MTVYVLQFFSLISDGLGSVVIKQPIFRIPNIFFAYFFIDFFVKHIFYLRHV